MKKVILNLLMISCLTVSSLLALDPPKPIQGFPSIMTKEYSMGMGQSLFTFKLPAGWGLGDVLASAGGPSHFTLFPQSGGDGCVIDIRRFDSEDAAQEALKLIKKTFKNVTAFDNGFEVELKKSWYRSTTSGEYLIETWYSLAKKKKDSLQNWQALKSCLVISPIDAQASQDPAVDRPAVEKAAQGWVCHHPENKVDLFFETFPMITAIKNEEESRLYLLAFEEFRVSGYFFVKWDQTNLNMEDPYQEHLKEIFQDVSKLDPSQAKTGKAYFDLEQGYGYLPGQPYNIITVTGDKFLFGFAFKSKNPFNKYDVNDLIKRVNWVRHCDCE